MLSVFLVAICAALAAGGRVVVDLGTKVSRRGPHVKMWCSLEDDELQCPEGTVISVVSAFHSRRTNICPKNLLPPKPKRPRTSCTANVTEDYISACNGHQLCPRPAKEQPQPCSENPWTSMRVRWTCVEGEAKQSEEELEEVEMYQACELNNYNEDFYELEVLPLGEGLDFFESSCGFLTDDVAKLEDGFHVLDDTRLCADPCQKGREAPSEQKDEIKSLPNMEGNPCGFPPKMEAELTQLQAMRDLTAALDDARSSCPMKPPGEPAAPPSPLCPDPSMARHDCGTMSTTRDECEAAGCCWDPLPEDSQREGRPFCYRVAQNTECSPQCPPAGYQPLWREDCAAFVVLDEAHNRHDKVREQACLSVGCCWQPLEHNSKEPWCFHKPCL